MRHGLTSTSCRGTGLHISRRTWFSQVAVEVPQRPVAQLVLHAPDATESLSHSGALELAVLHFGGIRRTPLTRKHPKRDPDHVAVPCHRPPQPHSISPLGSTLQHVRSWISPEHDLCKKALSHVVSSSGTVDSTPVRPSSPG